MSRADIRLEDVNQADLRSLADRLLETTRVEYVDGGVLLVMNPPGFEHRMIVDSLNRTFYTSLSAGWRVHSQDFQWDLPDGLGRFYIPDIAVVHPGAKTAEQERAAIELVAEVTSPVTPITVVNDREIKPVQYARAKIPLYLLVDQERGAWILHELAEEQQGYLIAASGKYGDPIPFSAPFGFAAETSNWPRYQD